MSAGRILLIRHGESTANVAAAAAEAAGGEVIPVEARDADVQLSPLGEQQARSLGPLLREELAGRLRDALICTSPYRRAQETATLALGGAATYGVDERLRDRELGIIDALTARGVEARLPAEAARRRWLGKFYYRPPGGEAWTDVALRVRSFLDGQTTGDRPLVLFTHDAVVSLFLYVLCQWDEKQLNEFLLTRVVGNASVTTLVAEGAGWRLESFADDAHLIDAGLPPTKHPGTARVAE
ncbi:histidine phosphatase family protein [Leifsonia poae]|uniref:histidine phosphatase family protein n=1 Tax=Leifsonia poae TaxID=110933 RepID=UPI003D6710AD